MDILCAALQQGGRIGLPLGGLHEPDHPLVTGHLHIPAEQGVGQPHQGIVPVEGQGQKATELDPVVPLIQVGPLVGQDLAALVLGHPGGDIDLRLQKAQNEGRLDFVRLPAAPDFHRVSHLGSEFQVGNQAVAQNHQSQQVKRFWSSFSIFRPPGSCRSAGAAGRSPLFEASSSWKRRQ